VSSGLEVLKLNSELLDALPDGILVADRRGRIAFCSKQLEALSGYSAAELVGQPVELLVPTRLREVHVQHRGGYAQAGMPLRSMGSGLQIFLRAKDGREIPVDIALSPLAGDEEPLVVAAVRDATERTRVEQELRESRERFQQLINGVQDYAIFMIDPQGRVASWNSGAERIKGYAAEEILGQPISVFYTPEDVRRRLPQTALAEAAENGRYQAEGWRLRKDGTRFWAEVLITALHDQAGKLRGFSKITRDATERKRAEGELRRLDLLEERERIGRELHDGVIQSLFAVGMNLHAAGLRAHDPELEQRIDAAVAEIDHAIRDLRNYIFGLRPGILADRQLAQALQKLAADAERESGVTVVTDVDAGVAARLASRAADVVQLLRESLSNVTRHAGAATCRVTLREEEGAGVLEVDDDGSGFDVGAAGGQGHGLGNLRERAETLGGGLELESTPGEGTTVRIRIPL